MHRIISYTWVVQEHEIDSEIYVPIKMCLRFLFFYKYLLYAIVWKINFKDASLRRYPSTSFLYTMAGLQRDMLFVSFGI